MRPKFAKTPRGLLAYLRWLLDPPGGLGPFPTVVRDREADRAKKKS